MTEHIEKQFYQNTWTVLDRYFDDTPYYVTRHHLDSFNRFLRDGIRSAIKTMNYPQFRMGKTDMVEGKEVQYDVAVYVGGKEADRLYLDKPTVYDSSQASNAQTAIKNRPLYPNETRLKNLTYASNLYADITIVYTRNNEVAAVKEFPAVRVCSIPIMLHSASCYLNGCSKDVLREMGECPYDMGGYFVVDGLEKIIIAQERTVYNRLFIKQVRMINPEARYETSYNAHIRCLEEKKSLFPWVVNFGVLSDRVASGKRKDAIVVTIPRVNGQIKLFHLFRALGFESDKAIMEMIISQTGEGQESGQAIRKKITEFLMASARDASGIYTQQDAVRHLASMTDYGTAERLKLILIDNFLPNAPDSLAAKGLYLAHLVAEIMRVSLGLQEPSQYDHYSHKRLQLSGFLVSDMFRDMYVRFVRLAKARLDQAYFYGPWKNSGKIENLVNVSNLAFIFDATQMDIGISASFKGRWNYDDSAKPGQEGRYSQDGVIQDLSRVSYQLYLSYVRRIDVDFDRQLKIVEPHLLRGSHWGAVCPVESPDGPSVGLLKHLAMLTHITFPVDETQLLSHLLQRGYMQHLLELSSAAVSSANSMCKVFVNDTWCGTTAYAQLLTTYLRALRRRGLLHPTTSVSFNIPKMELRVCTTSGRFARPLYIVDNEFADGEFKGAKLRLTAEHLSKLSRGQLTWQQLVNGVGESGDALGIWGEGALKTAAIEEIIKIDSRATVERQLQSSIDALDAQKHLASVIEYVDVEELETLLVAATPADFVKHALLRYTHCEIHSCTIFSMASAIIPFLHHNNAAYNSLALAQTKQAIGVYATNFANRFDVAGIILNSPQLPLVTSKFAERMCDGKLMHGENLIVAIASYTGYNQDDGCIINADSAMRGLFNVSYYHTMKFEEDEYGDERLVLSNPMQMLEDGKVVEGLKDAVRYKNLDEHGFPLPGTVVREGMVICGKVHMKTDREISATGASSRTNQQEVQDLISKTVVKKVILTDRSDVADRSIDGMIVDKVISFRRHSTGKQCVKIRLRKVRTPELGDKLASRFAQKGVIGMVLRQEDMPYTASGLVPDLILNPNAFPKRMTVGHLLDCILSKVCAVTGTRLCHNPFEPKDVHGISETLQTHYGLNKHGDEIMYCGYSGTQMQCAILIGPTYTGRLKHMVADKMNYRDNGPVNFLTRQPTKSRGKHGGLRVGEMEEHVLLAHGMTSFLKESFMERSDGYEMVVDGNTGTSANVVSNPAAGLFATLDPETSTAPADFKSVAMPYAFKLMQQELQAMSIDIKMKFQKDDDVRSEDDEVMYDDTMDENDDGDAVDANGA